MKIVVLDGYVGNPGDLSWEPLERLGDVTVYPGDLIFGDCDGVVVIHQEDEDSVIPKALEKFEYEKEVIRRLRAGESTMSVYGFNKLVASKQK